MLYIYLGIAADRFCVQLFYFICITLALYIYIVQVNFVCDFAFCMGNRT